MPITFYSRAMRVAKPLLLRQGSSRSFGSIDINQKLHDYASKSETEVTMMMMMKTAMPTGHNHVLRNAQFLLRELPKRLAKRTLDLKNLPFVLQYSVEIYTIHGNVFFVKLSH